MFHFDTSVLAKEALLMRARRFFSGTKKTILLPMAGRLYGVDMQEGKFLRFASVPFPHDKEPEKIAEALEALAEKGIRGKSLMLIATSRDLRTKVLNLPEMDEDEMHESLSWEEDRIFPGDEPLRTGLRVLSHTPQAWHILFSSVYEITVTRWIEGARLVKKRLVSILPVTDIPLADGPYGVCFAAKSTAQLFFYCGEKVRSLKARQSERDKIRRFFLREADGMEGEVPCFLVPLFSCTEEEMAYWKAALLAAISGGEVPEENPDSEEYEDEDTFSAVLAYEDAPDIRDFSEEESSANLKVMIPAEEEGFLHETAFRLLMGADKAGTVIPSGAVRRLFTEENRGLRMAQGAAVLSFLFCLTGLGMFVSAEKDFLHEKELSISLSPVRKEMEAYEKEQHETRALEGMLRKLEKENMRWEQKLAYLGESMPSGVVLREIAEESGEVRLEGTAQTPEAVGFLRDVVASSWGGETRIGKRKGNPLTKLTDFTIIWTRADETPKTDAPRKAVKRTVKK